MTLVRSPTLTKFESGRTVNASIPLSRNQGSGFATSLGSQFLTASEITRMCSGVVPQHPPTIFNQPFCAHSRSCGASVSGVSGKPVGNKGLGRPAFGYELTLIGEILDNSSI